MDFDVEIEARRAADRGAEPPAGAHLVDFALQLGLQVLVLAAQIDEALGRAGDVAGDRHAFEHPNRERVQQHPVLESAGLAFVGVADDVALGAGRVAGAVPFRPDREPGAAPPAQVGALHLVEHPLPPAGDRRVERDAGGDRRQQGLAPADIVLDPEQLGRPFVERRPRLHQIADLVDPAHRQARNGAIVGQQRRALVAHAGVGGQIDAHQAVGRHLRRA